MYPEFKNIVFSLLICHCFFIGAQTTISIDEPSPMRPSGKTVVKHKVLLVPFEYKMYMSEIDHLINAETRKSQREIRWSFQDKIDQVLYKQFKSKYEVKSLTEDTVSSRQDLNMIYRGVGYKFDRVPSQKNYKAPKSDYQREGKIQNGQISAETNHVPRFMNVKLQDKLLLQKLNKKYHTDVFVFINQLDIRSAPPTSAEFGAEKLRKAVVHYTVFDLQGKEINSGIAECQFPKSQNDPDKISVNYIVKALEDIYQRVDRVLNPVSSVTGK